MTYDFNNYKKDTLTKPRDLAWTNWAKFEKVGDKVQGFIADVFYRKAEGQFDEQRGITLKQADGSFINVAVKRLPFILSKTDDLRLGDPLTVELVELKKSETKGFSPTKISSYFGKNMPENAGNKTVAELDNEDRAKGGTAAPAATTESGDVKADDIPFE